jgi:hypothetical protein
MIHQVAASMNYCQDENIVMPLYTDDHVGFDMMSQQ